MDIRVFQPHEGPTVLRTLRTALATEGSLSAPERSFIDTFARIAGLAAPSHDPAPLAAHEVAIADAHARKRLLQLAAMAVLLARPVKPASADFLRALAAHLQTHDPVLDVITALQRGRHRLVRVLTLRRGLRAMLREAHAAEGARGVLRFLVAMFAGGIVDPARTRAFRRLGLLPEGTLGRTYWRHMTTLGFGFPGERGGIPASVAYHDVAHVLAGHDTTPQGEIQQGAFQAGNRREDGFFFILFVILQFHQGLRITPGAPPATGHFDPALVLWALHRGASCQVDMTHQWDFWPLMDLPLGEARARCGLLPKLEHA